MKAAAVRPIVPWLLLATGACSLVLTAGLSPNGDVRGAEFYTKRELQAYFDAFTSPEREVRYRALGEQLARDMETAAVSEDDPAAGLRDFLLLPARLEAAGADDLAAIAAPAEVAEAHASFVAAMRASVRAQEEFADQFRGPDAFGKLFGDILGPNGSQDRAVVLVGDGVGNGADLPENGFETIVTVDSSSGGIEIPGLTDAHAARVAACKELQSIADRHQIAVDIQCETVVDFSLVPE